MTSIMHMTKRLLGAVEVARQTLAAGEEAAKKAKGLQAKAEGLGRWSRPGERRQRPNSPRAKSTPLVHVTVMAWMPSPQAPA